MLLVSIDTLRADRVGVYGGAVSTPRMDRLAHRGIWFARARTVVPLTLPSHASLLTGLHPAQHGVHNNGSFRLETGVPTLAEIARGRGWRTGAVVGSFILDAQFGLARGFEQYDGPMSMRLRPGAEQRQALEGPERDATAVTDAALRWLERRGDEPFLLWVHYFDPHTPYVPPEPFASRHPGAPYDGEVAYVDHELGRLLEALSATALGAETLIVVVGDHGESLGEHGEATHGVFLYEAVLRVPFILSGAGVPPRGRVDRPVSTVDLLPTLLGILGIPPPAGLPGRDLLDAEAEGDAADTLPVLAETRLPCLNFGWSGSAAIIEGSLKLIRGATAELYDLESDPAEARNLSARRPAERQRLEERLASVQTSWHLPGMAGEAASPQPSLLPDPETRARLESLGYLAGSAAAPDGCRSGADPRRMLPVLEVIERGALEFQSDRYQEAAAAFRQVTKRDPGNIQAHYYLAQTLREMNRHREAAEEFAAAGRLDPDNLTFRHDEAAAWFALGDLQTAEERLRQALARAPGVPKTQFFLGNVRLARGRPEEALLMYESAREAMPPVAELEYNRGRALLELGRHPEAIEALRQACRLSPQRSDWHGLLAGVLAGQGRGGEAIAVLREFVGRHPEDWLGLYNLGRLLEASAERDGALQMYRRAETHWGGDPDRLEAMRSRIRALGVSPAPP